MRKRNILKTIYLSKEENKLLLEECKIKGINQSECLRKMIVENASKKYVMSKERLAKYKKEIEFRIKELETFLSIYKKENNFNMIELIQSRLNRLIEIFDDIYVEE